MTEKAQNIKKLEVYTTPLGTSVSVKKSNDGAALSPSALLVLPG